MQVRADAKEGEQPRGARLPVRAGGKEWLPEAQPRLEALPPVPRVAGITVVDELAEELERQRQRQAADQEERQELEQQQRRQDEQQGAAAAAAGKRAGQDKKGRPGAAATGLDALKGIHSRELRRKVAKQQLATTAQQLLQDPEKHLGHLKMLLALLGDEDPQVGAARVVGGVVGGGAAAAAAAAAVAVGAGWVLQLRFRSPATLPPCPLSPNLAGHRCQDCQPVASSASTCTAAA